MKHLRPAFPALLVSLLAACGGGGGGTADPDFSTQTPASACASLKGLKIDAAKIALETKGAEVTVANFNAATTTVAEHCLVQGSIRSVDASAEPIKFQASLPTTWVKGMAHLGGGGFDGNLPDVVGAGSAGAAGVPPLSKGYVAFGGDSGHGATTSPGGTFALNQEQLRNFSGDHLKKTRDAVLYVVRARYGASPNRTYFFGGSGGGRQALHVAMRYPADYDGIVSFFPAYAWTPLFLKFQEFSRSQHLNEQAGFYGYNKAKLLMDAQLRACDSLDGAQDGLIGNLSACNFDPATVRCPDGVDTGDTCLSDAQIAAARTTFGRSTYSIPLANGISTMAGFPLGAQFPSAFYPIGSASYTQPPTFEQLGMLGNFADNFLRYFVVQDAGADILHFDPNAPGKYQDRLFDVSKLMDRTDVSELKQFVDKGGKLILLHGGTDQIIPTGSSIDLYNRLLAEFGRTKGASFMRFHIIPGYAHGDGAFVPQIPFLEAMANWVERGTAPASLVATDLNPSSGGRTRPVCDYPMWPKYKGSGDLNSAASFSCSAD